MSSWDSTPKHVVSNEVLYRDMMDLVTKFWKKNKAPLWKTAPHAWFKCFYTIYKYHKQARSISAEVNHWIFRYRIGWVKRVG